MGIRENVKKLLSEIPPHVNVVAATKGRGIEEIKEAIESGIKIIGENYIQEAKKKIEGIPYKVEWHFIGHLQRNKARYAVKMFDMIETVDSPELAFYIDKYARKQSKIIPVLIEVNIGEEPQKFGVLPWEVKKFIMGISPLENIKIMGLMTMGPYFEDPEKIRPYFKKMKEIFEDIKEMRIDNVEMKYLSMGMSNTYKIAMEEGANIIRIGTAIFGERKK